MHHLNEKPRLHQKLTLAEGFLFFILKYDLYNPNTSIGNEVSCNSILIRWLNFNEAKRAFFMNGK